MPRTLRSFVLSTLVAGSAVGQCASLATPTPGGNSQHGSMFDVVNVAATSISIGSFDQCFHAAGSSNVYVYTKTGTWSGFENTPAAWTLVGGPVVTTHGTAPTLDPIPLPINVTIPQGATQAFYITTDTLSSIEYTSGIGVQVGAIIASNSDLQVLGGIGKAYPFAASFGLPTQGRLWHGRINYCPIIVGTVFATNTTLGAGCGSSYASFYENFPDPPTGFDLGNTSFTMTPAGGGGYVVGTGGAFIPVGATSTPLVIAVGDDVEQTVTLTAMGPFPTATGPATSLTVCSNGFVSTGSGNGINWSPTVPEFLNSSQHCWRVWHDFSNQLGGSVKFEESATVSVITWDNVRQWNGTGPLDDSTFQLQFYPSGAVTFAFATMSTTNTSGTGYLVGYSPGGNSIDPGSVDLSATLGASITTHATDGLPLTLAATNRPITNTNWTLAVSNIPPTGVFGISIYGIADPGIPDLFFLGMPGCQLRSTLDALDGPWFPSGPTKNYSFAVPNSPSVLNFHLFTQAIVWTLPALNPFGAITSGGIEGMIGDY